MGEAVQGFKSRVAFSPENFFFIGFQQHLKPPCLNLNSPLLAARDEFK
jgi:hypothetical protein